METASGVVAEFSQFLNESTFVHGLALGGARAISKQMAARAVEPSNPNPLVSLGSGDPNLAGTTFIAQLRMSDMIEKTRFGGSVDLILGQQWIVFVFAAWDEEYRKRLASVHGCDLNDLRYPIMGDLRHLRHDVVHNRGIASSHNSGKCLVMKPWFTIGSPILMTHEILTKILSRIPFEEMEAGPTKLAQ